MSENSRVEGILQATIDGDEYTDIPQSRVEELLIELKEVIEQGGGGTTVEANPEGESTDDLTKIKIGNTIYDISSSGGEPIIYKVDWIKGSGSVSTGAPLTNGLSLKAGKYIIMIKGPRATSQAGNSRDILLYDTTHSKELNRFCIYNGHGSAAATLDISEDSTIEVRNPSGFTSYWSLEEPNYSGLYAVPINAIGEGGSGGGTLAPMIYSLEEREVGVWVDDKPLYQRTFDKRSLYLTDNTWSNNILGTTGIQIVHYDGYFSLGSDEEPSISYSYYRSSTEYFTATIDTSYADINVRPNMNYGNIYAGIVTIWYTKDSDVPGSGSYDSLSVPMVHYDDTEKVVGTYFGKTLYEKSYTNFSSLTGQSRTLDFGLSGIDKIWYVSEGCIISDGLYPFPYIHWDPSNVVGGFWDLNDGSPRFEFRTGSQSTNAVIDTFTIRYTKTTD